MAGAVRSLHRGQRQAWSAQDADEQETESAYYTHPGRLPFKAAAHILSLAHHATKHKQEIRSQGSSCEDQWIALIFQPSAVRVRTMSSAPREFTDLPWYLPEVVLVAVVQAMSPRTVTRRGERLVLTALANAMSAGKWCDRYCSRDSTLPPSRTSASAASLARAARLSPFLNALW